MADWYKPPKDPLYDYAEKQHRGVGLSSFAKNNSDRYKENQYLPDLGKRGASSASKRFSDSARSEAEKVEAGYKKSGASKGKATKKSAVLKRRKAKRDMTPSAIVKGRSSPAPETETAKLDTKIESQGKRNLENIATSDRPSAARKTYGKVQAALPERETAKPWRPGAARRAISSTGGTVARGFRKIGRGVRAALGGSSRSKSETAKTASEKEAPRKQPGGKLRSV